MPSICEQRRCQNPLPKHSRSHRRFCGPSCRAMESQNRRRDALALFAQANDARAAGHTDRADALDGRAADLLASGLYIGRRQVKRS